MPHPERRPGASLVLTLAVLVLVVLCVGTAHAQPTDPLARAEAAYADWLDASYALATIAAGPASDVDGLGRAAWETRRDRAATRIRSALAALGPTPRGERGRLAALITRGLESPPYQPAAPTGDTERACAGTSDATLDRKALSAALYACFERYGNHLAFEGRNVVRTTALELLQELPDTARRRALFDAFAPLWQAVAGDGTPASPYRRLVRLAAAEGRAHGGTPVDAALHTVGADRETVERWLVAILGTWRDATSDSPVEPWDFWQAHTRGSRALDDLVGTERILPLTRAFYRDLGVDLDQLGVQHDLGVRDGKAPLAYCDFVRIGREQDGHWRPAITRVSANVEHGGLYVLNEIVHEDGHAVHASSIHVRPAEFTWGDDLYVEAFADVTSWSVAEPAWQERYLGRSVPAPSSLEALYTGVILDVAWGLFELRMLKDPGADPNVVWTDITSTYLHVRPHPELPWWLLRVQLVDIPGYMINYGLGAVLTADLRARTREAIGPFDAGNARWYGWTRDALLRHGGSIPTDELLRHVLGRPVAPQALLLQLARIRPAP